MLCRTNNSVQIYITVLNYTSICKEKFGRAIRGALVVAVRDYTALPGTHPHSLPVSFALRTGQKKPVITDRPVSIGAPLMLIEQ